MATATLAITGLLSLFFLFAGSIKSLGWHKAIFDIQLAYFRSYGLSRAAMRLVGVLELFGAVAICFHGTPLALVGAAALAATSVGAIYFHLRFDSWREGVPAMVTLALSSALLVLLTR